MNPKNKLEIINNHHDIINKNLGKTEIKVIKYNKEHFKEEEEFSKCTEIKDNERTWIKITHVSKDKSVEELFKCFKLNPSVLKKVLQLNYIPEVEDYTNYIYIALTAFYVKKGSRIKRIQVSIILGENFVISLNHDDAQIFNSVIKKLGDEHQIRQKGADYLAYALIDAILDTHIVVLREVEDEISEATEEIMDNPSNAAFRLIHSYRKELDKIRHYVLPLQEIVDSMELTESSLINQSTNTFLKNFRSHVTQVIARIDTLSNRITELRDIYNSSMSRKLDVTVRVLTVVTVIFAPLTFIVGLYGMNFQFMPELEHPFGYPAVLIIIFILASSMLIYFKRRNWI
jgi:magnesium transporter